jgi:purine-binding chemotaxis protein CheW
MSELAQWVVFVLGTQRFALALAQVQRVVAAAHTTPLPGAPEVVLGLLDVGGEVVAVLDPRARLQLPATPVSVDDQFLLVRTGGRTVAVRVDRTLGVVEREVAALSTPAWAADEARRYEGTIVLDDGLVLIHDIDKFLSPQEEQALDQALEEHR